MRRRVAIGVIGTTLDTGKTYTWGANVNVPTTLKNGQSVALTVDPANPNAVTNVTLAD